MASAKVVRDERFIDEPLAKFQALQPKLESATLQSPIPPFGCGKRMYTSAAPLPTCLESCSTCASQYLPWTWKEYPVFRSLLTHDDSEAAHEVQMLTDDIYANLAYISKMIGTYGDTLLKRWQKRTQKKRADLLLRAMPEIPKQKWAPAIEPALLRTARKRFSATMEAVDMFDVLDTIKSGAFHLLPYVDLPTLSKDPSLLLLLLHNRSHTEPSEWVMFDYEQVRRSFDGSALVRVAHNPHCVSMQRETFGQLVPWRKDSAHSFNIIGYPRARLILQAQAALAGFLRRSTELILGGQLAEAASGRNRWDAIAAIGFKDRTRACSQSPRVNQAFSTPPKFDLQRTVDMLRSRRNAAADELWLFQVDPAYTRRFWAQLNNSPHHTKQNAQQKLEAMVGVLIEPLFSLHLWEYFVTEAERILGIQTKYQRQIDNGTVFPAEYDMALRELHYMLKAQLPTMVAVLKNTLVKSGGFRNYFKHNADGSVTAEIDNREELFHKDPIMWNLIELFEHDQPFSFDPSWHIAFIDDILSNATPKERARVDTVLYSRLSALAAVSDAITALNLSMPRHGPMLHDDHFEARMSGNKAMARLKMQLDVFLHLISNKSKQFAGSALRVFLDLPAPPVKVTEKSYDRTNDLRQGLCNFWMAVRIAAAWAIVGPNGDPDSAKVMAYTEQIWAAGKDVYQSQWKEELLPLLMVKWNKERADKAAQSQLATDSKLKTCPYTPEPAQTTWGSTPEEAFRSQQPKQKQKTRPETSENAFNTAPELEAAEPPTASANVPAISVTKANRTLFTSMFAAAADMRTCVRWDHFVGAMADAGFSATHNGGSAVTFKDEKQEIGGAIVVHRPHPDPSIDPVMLRSIGKRFKKWFGWDAQTFVERQ